MDSEWGQIHVYNWSPDSKWIVFSNPTDNQFSKISVYNLDSKEIQDVTDNWYDSGSPRFSADGKYIVFVSERDFNPTYSSTEWNHSYSDMARVYLAILSKDTPSPFALENDTVKVKEEKAESKKDESKDEKAEVKSVKIDFDGLQDRIVSLPIKASNYYNVNVIGDNVYYSQYDHGTTTKLYDLKDKKETDLGKFTYGITSNNKKMIVREKGKYAIISLPVGPVKIDKTVDTSNMKVWGGLPKRMETDLR